MEPCLLIISCVPSKNIIRTKTCNYTHSCTQSLHTLYHPRFRHQLFLLLNCLVLIAVLLFLFFKLFSTPLSHLLPTTPMILFFSVPASSFQPVFISCSPFIYPYPPNSNPILSFSSLVATFPICFSPTPLIPPLPPLRLPSLPQLLFFFLLDQNRHLNNEPGVSQTARELH